ncbi:MAG TPA: type II secretion system F family protein [Jiangellaceae bacterium]|nr:type II secretion system F family protein [Jiangellaceae bacterium]
MMLSALLSILGASGIMLLLRELLIGHPRLSSALDRIDGTPTDRLPPTTTSSSWFDARSVQIGTRLGRYINPDDERTSILIPSRADLAIVGQPYQRILGQQIMLGLLGTLVGALFAFILSQGALPIPPLAGPVIAALALGCLCFFVPVMGVRNDARAARVEYTRTAATYLELMAIARISGAGAHQALVDTATISGHRHFRRIARLINQAQWEGRKAWDALQDEGRRLQVPALAEIGDILRLAGDSSAQVYDTLQARASTMRNTQLAEEKNIAKQETGRMTLPQVTTAFLFLLGIMFPAMMRLVAG